MLLLNSLATAPSYVTRLHINSQGLQWRNNTRLWLVGKMLALWQSLEVERWNICWDPVRLRALPLFLPLALTWQTNGANMDDHMRRSQGLFSTKAFHKIKVVTGSSFSIYTLRPTDYFLTVHHNLPLSASLSLSLKQDFLQTQRPPCTAKQISSGQWLDTRRPFLSFLLYYKRCWSHHWTLTWNMCKQLTFPHTHSAVHVHHIKCWFVSWLL